MQIPFKFELGEILKDIVTGYTGVAMGRTQYFTGCNHYGLLSQKVNKDGDPDNWCWFDQSRLARTNKAKVVLGGSNKPTSAPGHNAPSM